MRAVYITTPPFSGSRYKYADMFSRVVDDFTVTDTVTRADFCIVHGDKSKHYKSAIAARLPYVLVEQDIYSLRAGLDSTENEREMIENAAAILFTSEDHRDYCAERYRLPDTVEVVHLRPLRRDLMFKPENKLKGKHIVYAGGLTTEKNKEGLYGYRAYHDVFRKLMAAGWTVHVYSAWSETEEKNEDFRRLGCVVHKQVTQDELYRELSRYKVGFHGYALTGPQEYVHTCRPNKCWEYLAAGIPTLSFNPGNSRKCFEDKWGIVADSLDDLVDTADLALDIKILPTARWSEVIDNDIAAFRRLAEVAASSRPAIRYPVRLARSLGDVTFKGRTYPAHSRINRETAVGMRDAGILKDPRIR